MTEAEVREMIKSYLSDQMSIRVHKDLHTLPCFLYVEVFLGSDSVCNDYIALEDLK